jgi:hypothetical protein
MAAAPARPGAPASAHADADLHAPIVWLQELSFTQAVPWDRTTMTVYPEVRTISEKPGKKQVRCSPVLPPGTGPITSMSVLEIVSGRARVTAATALC